MSFNSFWKLYPTYSLREKEILRKWCLISNNLCILSSCSTTFRVSIRLNIFYISFSRISTNIQYTYCWGVYIDLSKSNSHIFNTFELCHLLNKVSHIQRGNVCFFLFFFHEFVHIGSLSPLNRYRVYSFSVCHFSDGAMMKAQH